MITQHLVVAGVGADVIDPDAKLSYKDEIVAGYEFEVVSEHEPGRALYPAHHRPRARRRGGGADGRIRPRLARAETVEYILTNPSPDTPTVAPELGASFEDPIHNYDAVELTLDRRFSGKWQRHGVVPLVAPARHVRGLLP